MNGCSRPHRFFSWIRRWWLAHFAPRRRPIVHYAKPALERLPDRSAPTAIGGATLGAAGMAALAAPPQAAALHTTPSADWHIDDSTNATQHLQILSSPPAKGNDSLVAANTAPTADAAFAQQFLQNRDTTALDAMFGQMAARRANPPRPQATNALNPQAMAGVGSRVGGVSTPNPSGGGSANGSGGGSGPGFNNSNQFFNDYLNMVGSALTTTPAPAPAPATPAPATQQDNAPPPAPTQTQAKTTDATTTPLAAAPVQPAGQPSGGDPLYVLDLNTGETVPANVPLNTFSTWSENLLAQVSGTSMTNYAWNLSQAPDLTNVSGTTTNDLQGTWTNFSGTARTDTITVTETPQPSGTPLSVTMTFLVAGTNSPAYSAGRPTIGGPGGVVTPDLMTSGQASQAAGPYASVGLADGGVQTSFSMPSYNPNTTPVSLDYSSTAANPQPIFLIRYQLPSGTQQGSTIAVQLTLNNSTPGPIVYYSTSGLLPGDWVQMALQANAASLSSGRYPWTIGLAVNYTPTNPPTPLPTAYSGSVDIVNQSSSPYGAGWSLDSVEQLIAVSGGIMLVNPDGTSLYFASNGQGGYTTPAGDFSTLVQNQNGSYTRTLPDGTQINFNSGGQETSTVDTDGNTTTFGYTGGLLTSITDLNGQVTTLAYTNGQLTSITDPANRTATLAYTGKQLTSITDPGNNVWQYAYDTANDLITLTDPNDNATYFSYNFADRLSSVQQADGSTLQLTAEQMNGLDTSGQGTNPYNAVPPPLLAVADQAQYTDANDEVWRTNLDWLGFGLDVQDTDPDGDTTLAYINSNGLPWLTSDALGNRTRDFFDNLGNVIEEVEPDDSFWQYQYNQFSEPTQVTDPTGYTTTYNYNTKGDLTSLTDALGDITTFLYNTAGLVTSTTDANGNTTTYGYNALNLLTTITNALNQTTTMAYDSAGDLTGITDALGYLSTFAYNVLGWLTGATLPDSGTTSSVYSYTYDKIGDMVSETTPLGLTITYLFNKMNELQSAMDPLDGVTSYTYDAAGNQKSATNSLGQTTFGYDAADRLTSSTDPLHDATAYAYDADGQLTSETNALNQTTTYGYTKLGQLASATNPLGDVTSYTYDAFGDTLSMSQSGPGAATLTTAMAYNAVHELTATTDPLNNTTTYGYDAVGNQTSVTDPLGHTTTYGYDALNQMTSMTDALGNATTYGYDADGNQISVTDPLGNLTSLTYDAQGRVLTQTAANGGVTSYTYDQVGDLLSLTDPDGNTTRYAYDQAGRLTSTTNPMGYATTYAYDQAGLLTATTDADGRTIDYGYNANGQETSETWVGGNYTATYTYDKVGELTGANDPYSSYTMTYDAAGDETSVSNAGTPGVPTVTLSYTYDAYSNRTNLTDSLGGSISYTYDADNQMTGLALSVSGTLAASLTFAYDAANRLTGMTRTAGSGSDTITTSYTYDKANELTNILDVDTTKSVTLANYTYGYDAAGDLTNYQDNSGNSLTYTYDKVGELTGASGTLAGSSYGVTYNYDLNGNRTSTSTDVGGSVTSATYATATGNELTSDGVYDYTYDKDGNMTSQTDIATGSVTYYTWDYENRLTEEKVENSLGTVLNDQKFTYDMFDNRIGVSLNGTQQLYTVYDGANPYMDFNGSGTLTERYLTNPNALSQFYGQVSVSGTTEWYLTDNIGSIRQVISTSGSSLDAITYDPYGNIVSQTNAANAPRFGYAGGVVDSLTGDDQFDARPYKPADGNFLAEDWEGFAAGNPNLYGYVFNSPLDMIDPSGLEPPYDANGKRILPQYTVEQGYGFDAYGVYSYYDRLFGGQVVPCIVCHGRNGLGRMPGLTYTDSFVNGKWYHSGSNKNILRNYGAGIESGFNEFMCSISPKLPIYINESEKKVTNGGGNNLNSRRYNTSPILGLSMDLIDRDSLIFQSGERTGAYGPYVLMAVVNLKIYAQLEKQLAAPNSGSKSIFKALRSAESTLAEHKAKLPNMQYKASVEITIRNVENQIETIKQFIQDKGLQAP